MTDRRWHGRLLGLALCATSLVASADSTEEPAAPDVEQAGHSRLKELQDYLAQKFAAKRRKEPDWLQRVSPDEFDAPPPAAGDELQVVVQRDRHDGADVLTLRYPLAEVGALRTYAGAGLSRTVYLAESRAGLGLPGNLERERSIGAAAEFGAEYRLSDRLKVSADLRWFDLAGNAVVLRSDNGLVVADDVAVGVSVGWRFR